ncbi:aquaporin [Nocardia takedensis]|uniref:aquaporin n=1 Tax=Nocardia takedensis TaxID=259390 RepID=UPI003F76EF13
MSSELLDRSSSMHCSEFTSAGSNYADPAGRESADMNPSPLGRRVLIEVIGTGLLTGALACSARWGSHLASGGMAQRIAVASTLTISLFAILLSIRRLSDLAHSNPLVSFTDWILDRRHGLSTPDLAAYLCAQLTGAFAATALIDAIFAGNPSPEPTHLTGTDAVIELAAIVVFITLSLATAGTGKPARACLLISGILGVSSLFTDLDSLHNPAILIAHAVLTPLPDIDITTVAALLIAQTAGCLIGYRLTLARHPDIAHSLDDTSRTQNS